MNTQLDTGSPSGTLSAAADKNDIEILVSYNGVARQVEVQLTETVGSVLKRAIALFGVTHQPHLLGLFTAGNAELSDASKVRAAGLTEGVTVYLRPSSVRGGNDSRRFGR
ncbi:MAG TPA: hypothetical protein VF160_07185 [Candidatus Dormibacteraeota bacterium]